MITFLPSEDYRECANILDWRRLGKQRVEAVMILRILSGKDKGKRWANHPAVKMWRDYEIALAMYGECMCIEWKRRGFIDNLYDEFAAYVRIAFDDGQSLHLPPWHRSRKLIRSHRSNLLRKYPERYRLFWPKLRDDLPYYWPGER